MADIIMDDKEITGVTVIDIEASNREDYVTFRSDETIQPSKTVVITESGSVVINPDVPFYTMSKVDLNVDIPIYDGEVE